MKMTKIKADIAKERVLMSKSASIIQKVWRGYKGRMLFRVFLLKSRIAQKQKNGQAIQIQKIVRGFNGRNRFKKLAKLYFDELCNQAREWKECFAGFCFQESNYERFFIF